MMKHCLNLKQLAERLGVHPETIRLNIDSYPNCLRTSGKRGRYNFPLAAIEDWECRKGFKSQ